MFEQECDRMETLFRQYQSPELDRTKMKELLTEVENFLQQFGSEPRLVTLHEEIKHSLK